MLIKKFNAKSGKYTVTFQIPCEQLPEEVVASQMNVVGDFNNWSISETPMKVADGIGYEATVKLKPGKYEYRYLINDHHWYNDWEADGYEPNRLQNADNCILVLDKPKKGKKGKKGKKDKKEKGSKLTKGKKAEAKSKVKKAPTKPKAKPEAKKEVKADDLKLIEGIGPKISGVLAEAGVTTFQKLSNLSVDEIKEMLKGKVRISHPDSWPEQAKLAAEGAMEKLQALQDSLIGGRKK